LGGGTIKGGMGGESRAKCASLFLFDPSSKTVLWKSDELLPAVHTYLDMISLGGNRVAGVAAIGEKKFLFLFDREQRKIPRVKELSDWGECPWAQGPRLFVRSGSDIFLLLKKAIVKVNPETVELDLAAAAPDGVTIGNGGAAADGYLYFSDGARLCRFRLPSK